MKLWYIYLANTIMWLGWAVFQLATGPVWSALIFDIVMIFISLGLTLWARHNTREGKWNQ